MMVVIMLLLLLVMLCSSAMALVHRYPFLQHRLTRPLRSQSTSHIAAATQQQDIPLPIIVPTRRSILDVNSTIEIAENRLIRAGDYVVHQDFGVGKFIGIKQVPVYLNKPTGPSLPAVVIKYRDGEVSIYQNFVTQMLWMFRAGNAGNFVLDSIIDVKAWSKRKQKATTRSQEIAKNLVNLLAIRNNIRRNPCIADDEKYREFEAKFAYTPTADQISCFDQVTDDLVNQTRPMDRLICGDVGFGKTEVAMRAAYRVVLSNRQVAFLAPTKILAQQHYSTLMKRMPDVRIELLQGSSQGGSTTIKKSIKDKLANGKCQVVIGTHAILSKSVTFHNLGLIVIDEEQRFGVGHKERLKSIATGVDVLTLSATPIPRTLQTSLSGLREMTLMKTPPPGRKEVDVTIGSINKQALATGIKREKERGGQVFIVVPYILMMKNITRMLEDIGIDVENDVIEVNGRLPDMEERIGRFLDRKATILLATTVIEIGVDMPNVNTLFVLHAERFGISTLHQLRGRVGRSDRQAYAYFLTGKENLQPQSVDRLQSLREFTALGAGYELARRDLEMRGYGSLFGYDQTGAVDIGPDLECMYLSRELKAVKESILLPIDATLLKIDDPVEDYCKSIGYWSISVLNSTIESMRYEVQIAKITAAYHLTDDKFFGFWKDFCNINVFKDIELMEAKLPDYEIPNPAGVKMIQDLLFRAKLRSWAPRIAIKAIESLSDGYLFHLHPQFTPEKWKKLQKLIPEGYKNYLNFYLDSETGYKLKFTVTSLLSKFTALQALGMLLSELSDASKQLLENLLVDGDKEVVDFEKLGYSTGKKPKRKKRIAMTRD